MFNKLLIKLWRVKRFRQSAAEQDISFYHDFGSNYILGFKSDFALYFLGS